MAIPATPYNLFVQQGNSQVFLSWSLVSGATSYSVQRSTDGITWATIATPSVNTYADASVTLQTKYYYQVASVNSSGTSQYTSLDPINSWAIPVLPGQLSLGEMRLRAQQRADKVNSPFISLPEWNFFLNQAYYELYDLLITVYEDYYVAPRLSFTTDGSSQFALPNGQNYSAAPALYKLYGVDCGLDNTNNAFATLKKFDFISRNRYVFPQIGGSLLGVFNLEYRMVGGNLMFIPPPSSGQIIGLWYYPRLTQLLQDTDVIDGISGWTQYPIIRAAKYAMDKEESDTSKLDAELLFLKARIEESAANRDAGQPDTISDTRSFSDAAGNYGGPGYDGQYGGF